MIKLLTNTYTPDSDALATDDWRLGDVNCGSCKHWSAPENASSGTCIAMMYKPQSAISVWGTDTHVQTHKDFGCSLFEQKS